jgi:hypothetical protein
MTGHKNYFQADYLLGPGPRLIKKGIYRAAISQSLRNTVLHHLIATVFPGTELRRKPRATCMMDPKQPQHMDYLNCLGSVITNDAWCTRKIKSRIAMAKAAVSKGTLSPENWT